jgi:hypothetical protein
MNMELLRYGHDSYGAPIVNGLSWELLPLAFWAGIAVIAGHLLFRAVTRSKRKDGG